MTHRFPWARRAVATGGARWGAHACLLGVGLLLAWSLAAPGQPPGAAVRLHLSDRPDDKEPDKAVRPNALRPNVPQEVFAYVKNDSAGPQKVTLQVLAGGAPVAVTTFEVAANALAPAPAVKAAPGDKGELKELKGPVVFRLVGAKGDKLGEDVRVIVDRPANYLEPPVVKFYPGKGGKNRLVAIVEPNRKEFKGPRCRVELVLRPERVPGLVPGQKKKGVYAGYLTGATKKLYLVAEDLQFTGAERKNGLVYLTVDRYERAFTFRTTFPSTGTATTAQQVLDEHVRLDVPAAAVPAAAFRVGVEVDGLKQAVRDKARARLEVLSPVPEEEKVKEKQYSEIAEFRGDREQRLFFAPAGPRGGLLFRPEVKDWNAAVDLSEVRGRTTLRLRLLDDMGNPLTRVDRETGTKEVLEAIETTVLDDSAPEDVRLGPEPKQAVRGKPLQLEASGHDPESKIREVLFFVGKPLPGGKLPADAVTAPGVAVKGKPNLWAGRLPVANDQKSPLVVSVRFTNGVGLSQTDSRELEVVDPPPVKAKKASIAGTVVEGDRPQKGLTVTLTDAAGKAIATAKTADGGKFELKDLEPGSYKVSAVKTASMTRGEVAVPLKEGEEKKGVEIKLYR
jgi:hypothetical protein